MKNHYKNEELGSLKKKCIVITGGAGMLGLAFNEVLASYAPESKVYCLSRQSLDVTDRKKVLDLEKLHPDLIIHCASIVKPDYCEEY